MEKYTNGFYPFKESLQEGIKKVNLEFMEKGTIIITEILQDQYGMMVTNMS